MLFATKKWSSQKVSSPATQGVRGLGTETVRKVGIPPQYFFSLEVETGIANGLKSEQGSLKDLHFATI